MRRVGKHTTLHNEATFELTQVGGKQLTQRCCTAIKIAQGEHINIYRVEVEGEDSERYYYGTQATLITREGVTIL